MTQARKIVRPDELYLPYPEFSPAVVFDRWAFVAGQTASDFKTGFAPAVRGNPHVPLAGEDQRIRESRYILESVQHTLTLASSDLHLGVRIDQYPTGPSIMDPYHVARREFVEPPRPASTSVPVSGLISPDARIAVEVIALLSSADWRKEPVQTDKIPQTIFGIVPAIRAGDFIFVAAQVATDFKTGVAPEARRNPSFWEGSEVDLQTRYMLGNFRTVLEAADSSLADVVKAQVYLTDIRDLPRLDRVWREYFPSEPPARTVLPANGLGVAGTRVEINLVALASSGRTRKETISTRDAPAPLFHEPQAVRAGNLLFLSGLLAADGEGLVSEARSNPHNPYTRCTASAEAGAIMRHADAICRAAGTRIGEAVRLLDVHTDLARLPAALAARRRWFDSGEPATTFIQAPGPLQVQDCTMLADFWVAIPD